MINDKRKVSWDPRQVQGEVMTLWLERCKDVNVLHFEHLTGHVDFRMVMDITMHRSCTEACRLCV